MDLCFIAFSSREPVSTSLENALVFAQEVWMFTRRDGLKLTLALAGTAAVSASANPGLLSSARADEPIFKVPPLGYGFDALEPNIDTMTMTIHHDRHHGAYVAALNVLVEKYPALATTSPVQFSPISQLCRKPFAPPFATISAATGTTPSFGS
jgi:Iron/manganese superoxide dismutases, alpha-hairpin domain